MAEDIALQCNLFGFDMGFTTVMSDTARESFFILFLDCFHAFYGAFCFETMLHRLFSKTEAIDQSVSIEIVEPPFLTV